MALFLLLWLNIFVADYVSAEIFSELSQRDCRTTAGCGIWEALSVNFETNLFLASQ